jgi:hypothetical protein
MKISKPVSIGGFCSGIYRRVKQVSMPARHHCRDCVMIILVNKIELLKCQQVSVFSEILGRGEIFVV